MYSRRLRVVVVVAAVTITTGLGRFTHKKHRVADAAIALHTVFLQNKHSTGILWVGTWVPQKCSSHHSHVCTDNISQSPHRCAIA